MQQLNEFAKK